MGNLTKNGFPWFTKVGLDEEMSKQFESSGYIGNNILVGSDQVIFLVRFTEKLSCHKSHFA